jgi:hypothetical protein
MGEIEDLRNNPEGEAQRMGEPTDVPTALSSSMAFPVMVRELEESLGIKGLAARLYERSRSLTGTHTLHVIAALVTDAVLMDRTQRGGSTW